MEFGTLEAILGGVSAGLGVSLLPRSVIENWEERGMIRSYAIPPQFGTVETVFAYRRDMLPSHAFNTFLSLLKIHVSAEPKEVT
jgi:DNA-binding transcriptional LysR family regulator